MASIPSLYLPESYQVVETKPLSLLAMSKSHIQSPPLANSQSQNPPTATLLDFLMQRDRYYPMYTSLSSYLGIGEIVALTRTCKELSHLYQEIMPNRWNIDRDLARFVEDPRGFRTQLGRHNALVSGSFAHYFFKGETWKMFEMDVFMAYGDGSEAFARYLVGNEGYEIELPPSLPIIYAWDCVSRNFSYWMLHVN